MAEADVQSPFVPRGQQDDKDTFVTRLDELLEQYLNTLDAYQKAQQQLTQHLSSGYISLAQANFNNTARMRYGADCYDERMQASRKVAMSEGGSRITFSASAPRSQAPEKAGPGKGNSAESPNSESARAEAERSDAKSDLQGKIDNASSPTSVNSSVDPIRWFGILVPPALRSAQASFVSAVEKPIPELATLARNLKEQEIEIGRLRKQLKKT